MPPTAQTPRDYSEFFIPASIILAGAIIGGGLFFGLSSRGQVAAVGAAQSSVNIEDVKTDSDPYIGEKDANVVLAYWSDFQCPYCKAVEVGGIPQIPLEPALPILIKEYVDTGKLKIVFKDYAFLSEDSTTAALYGRAVWDLFPDKYYEWREAMYKAQDEEHGGFGNEASIVKLIGKISGMNESAVKDRVAAKKSEYTQKIDADRAEGTSFGINGTPGFITGTTLIPGAAEFSKFKEAIDAQL